MNRSTTPSGPLPDLRSLPAWGIAVEKGRYLNFAATVWNDPRNSAIGYAILLAGMPACLYWLSRRRTQ